MIATKSPKEIKEHNQSALKEIANMMNLTKERVRQIEVKTLLKLRKKTLNAGFNSSDLY